MTSETLKNYVPNRLRELGQQQQPYFNFDGTAPPIVFGTPVEGADPTEVTGKEASEPRPPEAERVDPERNPARRKVGASSDDRIGSQSGAQGLDASRERSARC